MNIFRGIVPPDIGISSTLSCYARNTFYARTDNLALVGAVGKLSRRVSKIELLQIAFAIQISGFCLNCCVWACYLLKEILYFT